MEDFPLSRWFRQSPLNAVWEGSGNVIVLDVFRALAREPDALPALVAEVATARDARLTAILDECIAHLKSADAEMRGRYVVERLALLLEACAIKRCGGPPMIYDAFVASRLIRTPGQGSLLFGTLDPALVSNALLERNVIVLVA